MFIGASDAIKNVLKLLICDVNGKKPGVMVPIPQYPLYSASLAEFNMHQIGYFLDESRHWGLDIAELQVHIILRYQRNYSIIVFFNRDRFVKLKKYVTHEPSL